jgi:hypothetical protein
MNIFTFATDVIRNITIVDAGAAFMAGTLVYFAAWGWQSLMARLDEQPQLTAEQAETAETTHEEFNSAAPAAIVTGLAFALLLAIVIGVAVWQMTVR